MASPLLHSPQPWTYTEDELFYHIKDATGAPIGALCKSSARRFAQGNLCLLLASPDVMEALRTQPAYGEDWKKKLRNAFACASGIVEHFLPARKKK
jgi:hypothetical protein